MIHLAVHLPYETKVIGSINYSSMYPIERSLHTLKQFVRNKAQPEGSIAKAYVMNELGTFCSRYLSGMKLNLLELNEMMIAFPMKRYFVSLKC